MITGNELRIGNYVNTPRENQNPFRIDGFEFLFKDYAKVEMQIIPNTHPLTWELKDLSPIPLTAAIFEKAGFTPGESGWFKKDYFTEHELNTIHVNVKSGRVSLFGDESEGEGAYTTPVKYLHELQNLYHSLTGSELPIELTQVERSK